MVQARARAVIATEFATVVNVELSSTVAAAQQTRQQQFTFTGSPRASALLIPVALLAMALRLCVFGTLVSAASRSPAARACVSARMRLCASG